MEFRLRNALIHLRRNEAWLMRKVIIACLLGAVLLISGCTTRERMRELVQHPEHFIHADWSQPVGSLSAGDSRSYNR